MAKQECYTVTQVQQWRMKQKQTEGGETRRSYIGGTRERTPSCFERSSLGDCARGGVVVGETSWAIQPKSWSSILPVPLWSSASSPPNKPFGGP